MRNSSSLTLGGLCGFARIYFCEGKVKTAQFHFLLADITAAGWQNAKSVLSAFTSYDYVTLIFRVKSTMNNTSFGIDAVSVRDVKANDLAISIVAPERYNVTAIYSDGESALSNKASITTTGINEVVNGEKVDGNQPAYNLSGQRVGPGYRGIVIRNGRKFIAK